MKKRIFSFLIIALAATGCKDRVSNTEGTDVNIQPVTDCTLNDTTAPVMSNSLTVEEDGSVLAAPTLSWEKASDSCELSHYELAIGSSAGASDILAFTNIGNVTSYQQQGLSLNYATDYYYSVKAVDRAGNSSSTSQSGVWKVFTPKTLTNLVLWLDAAEKDSISDSEGDHPGQAAFSNDVKTWSDLSDSSAIHNFVAGNTNQPNWDVVENAVRFNGSNQFMATADHMDINTSDVEQRTLAVDIKTDTDINSRQVIFEEGGGTRGLNIYIENNEVHCGFWNNRNDGDGTQPYVEVSSPVEVGTQYVVSYVFDYSHFSGANGADGTVECFVNESSIGQVSTTSRLHAHSGDIGLGAMNDGSHFPNGAQSNDTHFFKGVIYEFLMYNSAHSEESIKKLYKVLQGKWL